MLEHISITALYFQNPLKVHKNPQRAGMTKVLHKTSKEASDKRTSTWLPSAHGAVPDLPRPK